MIVNRLRSHIEQVGISFKSINGFTPRDNFLAELFSFAIRCGIGNKDGINKGGNKVIPQKGCISRDTALFLSKR